MEPFVFINDYGTQTVDFSNPKAVRALNKALLFAHYNLSYWGFPEENLCPPIPGRVEYIHRLSDLLASSGLTKAISVLDVGTGASCIYPLLGNAEYSWKFVASDIDKTSLNCAESIIEKNELKDVISLRYQSDSSHIFKGVIKPADRFCATLCNPPFYKDETEALEATKRKLKGLGDTRETIRNFSGLSNELWYKGGEKAFVHTYLYESSLYKNQCFWFTTLVSKKEHVKSMYKSLKKLGATAIKTIEMKQGNKISRLVAWTFLTKEEQKKWNVL